MSVRERIAGTSALSTAGSSAGHRAPVAGTAAPFLRVVPLRRARTPRMPFVVLVVLLLAGGFLGLLLVNTALQQGAFAQHDLERQTALLSEQHQQLSEKLAVLEAPASLAAKAQALGMVRMASPVFLRLSDGVVLGSPQPARPMAADDPMRSLPPVPAPGGTVRAAGPTTVHVPSGLTVDPRVATAERAYRAQLGRPRPAPVVAPARAARAPAAPTSAARTRAVAPTAASAAQPAAAPAAGAGASPTSGPQGRQP